MTSFMNGPVKNLLIPPQTQVSPSVTKRGSWGLFLNLVTGRARCSNEWPGWRRQWTFPLFPVFKPSVRVCRWLRTSPFRWAVCGRILLVGELLGQSQLLTLKIVKFFEKVTFTEWSWRVSLIYASIDNCKSVICIFCSNYLDTVIVLCGVFEVLEMLSSLWVSILMLIVALIPSGHFLKRCGKYSVFQENPDFYSTMRVLILLEHTV